MNNEYIRRNEEKKVIRNKILNEIYNDKMLPNSVLSAVGLDIYSKSMNMYDRLNRAVKESYIDQNIVLTDEQFECLNLLSNNNLFISAPTSFGKTFIALEFIYRNINLFNNVIFVVPTIALMNELRKKCFKCFGNQYIIITSEAELDKNIGFNKKILILVPERINSQKVRKYLDSTMIDFAVYDEIYKLNVDLSKGNDNARLITMNYAYKYLTENAKKLLLLGPFIKNASFTKSEIKIDKFITDLNLVYNEVHLVTERFNYFEDVKEKQFIYFSTPNHVTTFLRENEDMLKGLNDVEYDNEIVNWMEKNVNSKWYYVEYLKKGIGIHHGNTPLFLRKYIEEEYANGYIHTILCTSTLIEGINTPTNKLIVYDTPRNVFELNNLIGRVGRLNVKIPKKGNVYFTKPETMELYDPDNWIDLNILFEQENIVSDNKEDEYLYLDKNADASTKLSVDNFKQKLMELFNIDYSEVIELGIEYKVIYYFIENFENLVYCQKEFDVIRLLKFSIIPGKKTFMNGLKLKKYSFGEDATSDDFLELDPVYLFLIPSLSTKEIIDKFIIKYFDASVSDLNLFIDTLFKVDEFIKFQLSKIVPVFKLFDSHNLLDKEKSRAFRQCAHKIEIYGGSSDGYERILEDIGFPSEDIYLITNEFIKFGEEMGTERKIIKLKDSETFSKISPFGKKIIESYFD